MEFLNLEYVFLAVYRVFAGRDIDIEALPGALHTLVVWVLNTGVVVSLILFAGAVYAHLRHEHIHHEDDHRRHEKARAHREAKTVKNERWEHVQQLMTSASQADWRNAIIEADIALFEMLTALSVPGDSIGEQLKKINRTSFNTIDLAWEAHKVRNEIAHAGSAYNLSEREARRTVDLYRQVFEEFDYI